MGRTRTALRENRNIILPNFITLLGLLCGVYSIVLVADGHFTKGALMILLASVFDGLDGKVARLVNGTSEFGVQLDSLADMVSFGVAPAVLMYFWTFAPYGEHHILWGFIPFKQLGMMAMFLYVAGGALRLARFNVQTKRISNIFFVGLPIPAAAGVVAASVLFCHRLGLINAGWLPYAAVVLVFALGGLMVSTVPYYSFKNLSFIKTKPFNTIVILVVVLFFIGLAPSIGIFAALFLYLLSGFVMLPFHKRLLLKLDKKSEAIDI